MKIHERIRALRNAKGITQEYIAHRLGIDAANYGRMERGEAKLTIDRLEQVLKVLETSVESFFADPKHIRQAHNEATQHQALMQELLKEMVELKDILTNLKTTE